MLFFSNLSGTWLFKLKICLNFHAAFLNQDTHTLVITHIVLHKILWHEFLFLNFTDKFLTNFRNIFRRNIDILQTADIFWRKKKVKFSGGIMTFSPQILIKSQTHFQKKNFQSNSDTFRKAKYVWLCLIFLKFVWNLVPKNVEKCIWGQTLWWKTEEDALWRGDRRQIGGDK